MTIIDKLKADLLKAKIENEKLKKSQFVEKLQHQRDKSINQFDIQAERLEFQKARYHKARRDKIIISFVSIAAIIIIILIVVFGIGMK